MPRALVIEDEPLSREVLSRLLAHEGWVVSQACNGRLGLEALSREPAQLIFLDLMMPEMDGFEVLARLREDPRWREIPVVVVSANDLSTRDRDRIGPRRWIMQKGTVTRRRLRTLLSSVRLPDHVAA